LNCSASCVRVSCLNQVFYMHIMCHQSIKTSTIQSINPSINPSIHQSINPSIHQSINPICKCTWPGGLPRSSNSSKASSGVCIVSIEFFHSVNSIFHLGKHQWAYRCVELVMTTLHVCTVVPLHKVNQQHIGPRYDSSNVAWLGSFRSKLVCTRFNSFLKFGT
jgi:hypothetical protein